MREYPIGDIIDETLIEVLEGEVDATLWLTDGDTEVKRYYVEDGRVHDVH